MIDDRSIPAGWHETFQLPLQGVGLCHGIAGSGYALLSHARATGDARQLRRAQQFALFAAQHWQQLYPVPDAPASLSEVGAHLSYV